MLITFPFAQSLRQLLTTGFVGNLTAALAVVTGQVILRKFRDWTTFSPMGGEYDECAMPTGSPTGGTVKIQSSGTILHTTATNKGGNVEWTGIINMNPLNPNVGDGTFHYKNKFDCGTHHVQRDPKTKDFIVLGSNTSHPEGNQRFTMLWRWKR